MNLTQKQFFLNRAASKKQIPILFPRQVPDCMRISNEPTSIRSASFLAVILAAGVLLGGSLAACADDIPYSPNEVARLQAFLQCPSMVDGKSNAELLGANLNDPATWSGVSWIDYDPDGDPWDKLPAKHVLHIAMGGSLAGALEVRDFPYMESFTLNHLEGTVVGKRSLYTSIVIKNNARLGGVYIRYHYWPDINS